MGESTERLRWNIGEPQKRVLRRGRLRSGDSLAAVVRDKRLAGRAGGYSVLADEPELRAKIRAQVAQLREQGVVAELRVISHTSGDPGDAIAEVAREIDADMIVVGTRGHGRVAGALLGSVTQQLLKVASCPVLAVPPAARFEQGEQMLTHSTA